VTGLQVGWLAFDSRQGQEFFLFTTMSRPALGPIQPPIQWAPQALSPGVKGPGCEADHSSPSNAEAKNVWRYTSILPCVLMVWHLVKHRNNFTSLCSSYEI